VEVPVRDLLRSVVHQKGQSLFPFLEGCGCVSKDAPPPSNAFEMLLKAFRVFYPSANPRPRKVCRKCDRREFHTDRREFHTDPLFTAVSSIPTAVSSIPTTSALLQ
jgi:hypothetical protein